MCPHGGVTYRRKRNSSGLACDVTARCSWCTEGLQLSAVPLELEKGLLLQPPNLAVTCQRAQCLPSAGIAVTRQLLINVSDVLKWNLLQAMRKDFLILPQMFFFFPPPRHQGKGGHPFRAPQRRI